MTWTILINTCFSMLCVLLAHIKSKQVLNYLWLLTTEESNAPANQHVGTNHPYKF